jgi:hypothetical protein
MNLRACLSGEGYETMHRGALMPSPLSRSIDLDIQTAVLQVNSPSKNLVEAFEKYVPLEVLHLMVGSSFMACNIGRFDHARTINEGLTPLFSKHNFVVMVCAIFNLATGRKDEALAALERMLKANPRDDTLLCMCALVKKELGVLSWRSLAQRVIDRGEDADAVRVAEELLAEVTAAVDKTAVPSAEAALAKMRFA